MAVEKVSIEKFLSLAEHHPILDVRSPGEYTHAHIPGAHSFPLFTDEERKIVGTAYKQQSREQAIKIGLDYFGTKMRAMVEEAEKILDLRGTMYDVRTPNAAHRTSNIVLVHCWRGGMRSAGVAWLLDLYGFKVYTLAGGYKSFRHWILAQLEKEYSFKVLGGYTGSGKTGLLKELERNNETIVDLEALANHKGSAFGAIGMPKQPSQEMFENLLGCELLAVSYKYSVNSEPSTVNCIWLEDESQRIGLVNIPPVLWKTVRNSPVYFVDIPFEERLDHIVSEYGCLDKEKVIEATGRIQKRLGGLETKTAIAFLEEGNIKEAFRILLKYYDKHYLKGLHNRENLKSLLNTVPCDSVDAKKNAEQLFSVTKKIISVK